MQDMETPKARWSISRRSLRATTVTRSRSPRNWRCAHCHLGLGKLYRRTGKQQEAQEHLATATTMYREMGMTYWLEQAEAEMRQLQ